MRRISLLTCFISLIYIYAHAETVYFQNPGDNWNYITENGSYKDSQGNDLPADWSAEDWANADVIISPEFMNTDHIAGVNADWTVKSLIFADGIVPATSSTYGGKMSMTARITGPEKLLLFWKTSI